MTPGAINIKGGSKEPLNVSFDDETGVTITSPKKLTLAADDEIIMKTPKSVKLKAESKILVAKQNCESGLSLETDMHFKSNNVIEEGSSRETYEAFNDEPKAGQKPEPKKESGFNWKKLALGVVAGLAIVASVVTFGLGLTLVGLATAAVFASGVMEAKKSYENNCKEQKEKNSEFDHFESACAILKGFVTGAVDMRKTILCATADWIAQTGLGMASLLNICTNFVPSCRDNVNAKIRELSNTSHEFYKGLVPKGYEDAFDYSQYALTVATLADSAVSINNIIKNPPKFSFGTGAVVDTMGNIFGSNLNPAVATAMATTAEVTGIAGFMGGSLFNFAEKDGSGTGNVSKNSDSDLLNDTGKFKDDSLQSRYDDYCKRKKDIGEEPREPLEWKEASEKWAKLREQGQAFSDESFAKFSQEYSNAEREITIVTNEGTKVRVDAIATDKNGNIIIQEYKSSQTAPYTKNQERGFPELQKSGGKVVGKGKGQFIEGYEIPRGAKIETIRP